MPIHLVCECGARVIAPTKRAGQSIRCPKCDLRINVPLGEGQEASAFSSPTRKGRLESAIADLVTARQADTPPTPKRVERIDPPQEKLKPKQPLAAPALVPIAPVLVPAASPAAPVHSPVAAPAAPISLGVVSPAPLVPARVEVLPKRDEAPVVLRRPPELVPIVRIDAPPIEIIPLEKQITQPIRIVTAAKAARGDKGWLGAVYGLAMLWAGLAVVGLAVAGAESYFYFRAEELWRLQRWALLVCAASAVQLGLAVYLVQAADWIACRSAAVVITCIAAAEAMVLAVTMFSQRDGWFARFLDLAPHIANRRALGVCLLLTLLSVLLAYTTASVSLAWQREERKLFGKRAAV